MGLAYANSPIVLIVRPQRILGTAATGQLPPFDDSGKLSSERLLHSETCRKTNSHNSAIAADGDLAEHYRYGSVTGHRPGNLAERRLSDFLCGSTQPFRVSPAEHIDRLNWHIKSDHMLSPEPTVKRGKRGMTCHCRHPPTPMTQKRAEKVAPKSGAVSKSTWLSSLPDESSTRSWPAVTRPA